MAFCMCSVALVRGVQDVFAFLEMSGVVGPEVMRSLVRVLSPNAMLGKRLRKRVQRLLQRLSDDQTV